MSAIPRPAAMARTRILVIEDERGLTDPLVYNLQREGYEAIVAHDGQEGLRKAQTLLPDLIILDLMPTEFRLLECLLRQPGRAFSRHQLMDAAIGEGAVVLERTIDVHIKTLRRKLGNADLIETVRGVGYRFREAGAS